MEKSCLLSLPAELRAIIFSSVLEAVHCKYPILVWDHISIASTAGSSSPGVGILLTCRTTYQDCIALLYDNAVLHMSVRGDTMGSTPWLGTSLGRIENCALLERLRHVQLEISYKASKSDSINRVAQRISKLSKAFKKSSNLKSIELIFFDEGSRWREDMWRVGSAADPIINAVLKVECDEVIAVSRNASASWNMSPSKWRLLRERASETVEEQEEFREITFDYWYVSVYNAYMRQYYDK
jgi:hypothetical protein